MPARDLKYLPQQGNDDNNVSRECLTPEDCVSASPPETVGDVDAASRPDENLEDARVILACQMGGP